MKKQVWERNEIKLTDREIELLKALKILGFEWLARDLNGSLFAYDKKPKKNRDGWLADFSETVYINRKKDIELFNFIKWEDEEPTKIDDLFMELKL